MAPARRTYLDWNASAPLHPRAAAAMRDGAALAGNPSSAHQEGRAARAHLERARAEVAASIEASADDIVWTSGGSEADAIGLVGLYRAARARGMPARAAVSA